MSVTPTGQGYFTNKPYGYHAGTDPNGQPGDALLQATHPPVVHVGGRARDAAAAAKSVTLGARELAGITAGTEVVVLTDTGALAQLFTDATLTVKLGVPGLVRVVGAGPSLTLYLEPGGYQLKHGGGSVSFGVA